MSRSSKTKAAKAAEEAEAEAKAAEEAEAEAKAAEEAEAKAKAEAEAKAAEEAEAKAKEEAIGSHSHVVEDGRAITCRRGIVGSGQGVSARDLHVDENKGRESLEYLVEAGLLKKAPAK